MSDVLCAPGPRSMVFARSSDRPPGEVQVAWPFGRRPSAGGTLRTQYLRIGDTGSCATFLSCPTWMWGAEHGVNEYGVAIGVARADAPGDGAYRPVLTGPDLVRLGLERARRAAEAVEVVRGLLQTVVPPDGGSSPEQEGRPPSFLMADPSEAYVLAGTDAGWTVTPVPGGTEISEVSSEGSLAWSVGDGLTPAAAASHLRQRSDPTGTGDTGRVTAAAMIAELPHAIGEGAPLLVYVAAGAPLTGVFVPAFPRTASGPPPCIPLELSGSELWEAAEEVRQLVAREPGALAEVRAALGSVEDDLWAEADSVRHAPERWEVTGGSWGLRALAALRSCIPVPG